MAIKRTPEDFVVDEVLAAELAAKLRPAPDADTFFGLYRLSKTGLATPEAIAEVVKELRVPPGAVAFGGLKDKYARTTQHVTLEPREPAGAARLPARVQGQQWRLERLGFVSQPMTAPGIGANRFRIVVRDLTRRQGETMDQVAELLTPKAETSHQRSPLRLVNYFGDQRFGSARHGQGFVAWHLIRGEFEEALRLSIGAWYHREKRAGRDFKRAVSEGWGNWAELAARLPRMPERRPIEHLARRPEDFRGAFTQLPYLFQQLCVYAYQSHLWNATARRLVEVGAGSEETESTMIVADDPFGPVVFPAADAIPAELAELNLPVLGRNTQLVEPWKAAAAQVLHEESIAAVRDLRIPGVHRPFFGEADRRLFVDATEFEMNDLDVDETVTNDRRFKRLLSFTLPRGAYATVVLRALGQ